MDIIALVATKVTIRERRLHHIDGSHKTRFLVNRIAVDDDVLDGSTELHVTTLLQPTGNAPAVKVVHCQAFVVEQ